MLDKTTILDTLSRHQNDLREFGVERIGLYGSYVRNEASEQSDIDLLVDFLKEKKTLKNLVYLADFLENVFQKKVEIVTTQGLSKHIGPYILKEVSYASFSH